MNNVNTNSFPKVNLTNRLFSNHRQSVHGALTKDSPAAAQTVMKNKKRQTHSLSRSVNDTSINAGRTARGRASDTPLGSAFSASTSSKDHQEGKKVEGSSILRSASAKTIFNSSLPASKSKGLRGHKNRRRFGGGATKKAWQGPGSSGVGGKSDFDTFVATQSSHSNANASTTKTSSATVPEAPGGVPSRPPTFTESLQLDEHYLEEFLGGNFVYLRPKNGLQRTAYDLECVEHFETNPDDYYTMSREGITHFSADESEFTSLDTWESEYAMFHQIRTIVFFRRYRLWKSFIMWMKSYRRRKMNVAAKEIQSKLPMFTPALQHTHLQIIRLCHDVSEWNLFALDPEKCQTLDEFIKAQALQRTQISDWLVGFSDDIRLLVRNACDDVLDAFLETNEIKAEHRMTFMEKAALRTECSRLVKYIRVVDIVVVGVLRQLALESLQKFLNFVSPTCSCCKTRNVRITASDEKTLIKTRDILIQEPFFQVEMLIEGNGPDGQISLSPSPESFEHEIQRMLRDGIDLINIPEPLLGHRDLQTYVTAAASGGSEGSAGGSNAPSANDHGDGSADSGSSSSTIAKHERDVVSLVYQATNFRSLNSGIFHGIKGWFDEVVEYTEVFAPYQQLYTENEGTRVSLHATFATVPMSVFRDAIAKYRAQGEQFSGIPYLADIGLVRVDSSTLKALLLPNPQAMVNNIRELLPLLMKQDSVKLIDEFSVLSQEMSVVPVDVSEFVVKMTSLDKAEALVPELLKNYDRFQQMARLCVEENGWALPDDIQNQNILLKEFERTVTESIERTAANKDEDIAKFAAELVEMIPVKVTAVMKQVKSGLDNAMIQSDAPAPEEVLAYLATLEDTLHEARENATNFTKYQEILEVDDIPDYEELEEVESDFAVKKALWQGIQSWSSLTQSWEETLMEDIVSDEMDKQVNQYVRLAGKSKMKLQGCPATLKLANDVNNFRNLLPVIVDLRNPKLKKRHWEQIEAALGHTFDNEVKPPEKHLLEELLALKVQDHMEAIQQISTAATAQGALVDLYALKVTAVWKDLDFIVNPYKEQRDVFILGSVEDIQAALDESLVQLNTILGSRYCAPIRKQVMKSQNQLLLLSDTLEEWLQCQKKWMYLETIFGAPDIQRQLPKEAALFTKVDKSWKEIMSATNNYPAAIVAGTAKGRKDLFSSHNQSLDYIQKNLEAYLETKRQAFPRFYFLSDDELLEILAQTRDPRAVQPHLRKCFDCIQALQFGEGQSIDVLAMTSPEGETVSLGKNLKARGAVEEWLMAVQDRMQKCVRETLEIATKDYDQHEERTEWVCNGGHPGQCVATGAQIMWSRFTEQVLRNMSGLEEGVEANPNGMKEWLTTNKQQVLDLVIMIRGKLSRLQRKVLAALITTDVFCKDQIDVFVEEEVSRVNDFAWQQQLRYYWVEEIDGPHTDGGCEIKHANATLRYMYEYMGCTSRLVITPLTVKAWLTITGAIHLKLGAAPSGPAGTGKTESSKDLAKALGTFCVVFNCSDQVDYVLLGRIFSGLAQCGCWCCLDEFNRILIEVLSVVAQQLLTLRNGMKSGKARIDFEGRNIALLSHCVIVTQNPGYAGRTALPDNLKVCFRPVAMMVPFYALISEIVLYSQGFTEARELSIKMAALYQLSSQQLSQQPHYDYGLRAIISVLLMAGGNKRTNPDLGEDVILIRAMRDSNLPKFLGEDVPLFKAILVDLFPGVDVPNDDYGDLMVAIKSELREHGLQEKPELIHKIIQLHDMIKIRFGVTIVGPTGGGKTVAYEIMCAAHTRLRNEDHGDEWYQKSRVTVINPKSITMGELFGENNDLTQEWTDGLCSVIVRQQVKEDTPDRLYIMFDGPIDTLWIESLNTVLDDNRMLCLANGERIRLKNLGSGPSEMRMLFEVNDLAQASPATVSRLGVVYYNPEDVGWRLFVQSWLPRVFKDHLMKEELREHLWKRFDETLDKGLAWQKRYSKEPIPTTPVQVARSMCSIFQILYFRACGDGKDESITPIPSEHPSSNEKIVDKLFAFAYVWSVGGSMGGNDDHEKFDDFCTSEVLDFGINFGRDGVFGSFVETVDDWQARSKEDERLVEAKKEKARELAESGGGTGKKKKKGQKDEFSTGVTLGDVPSVNGDFRAWKLIVPSFEFDPSVQFFSLFVPTIDTVRYSFLMQVAYDAMNPIFFTGITGTGKSAISISLLNSLSQTIEGSDKKTVLPVPINFSGQTVPKLVQSTIENKLEKKRKDLVGAPVGKNVVLFIDDVNMPIKEIYGTQPPIELLRHLITHQFLYDRDKLFKKNVQDVVTFAAAAPPGGGRATSCGRFTSLFHMLCVPKSSEEVLFTIFSSILGGFFEKNNFNDGVQKTCEGLVNCTIKVYIQIAQDLRPTPTKSHYTFNLRDVAKVFQGVLMVRPKEASTSKLAIGLWMHECNRVFYDRLATEEDRDYFHHMLGDMVGRTFSSSGLNYESCYGEGVEPMLWSGIQKNGTYDEIKDLTKFKAMLNEHLDDYNLVNPTQMKLVFFMDAIKHICRISRILMQPRGNAMLIGVGGSGKQSVTRIACHIGEMTFYQLEIGRGYNHMSFLEDLKEMMLIAGVEGKPLAFVLLDTQIIDESFLEDVNNVLNTGEVPNLFEMDEYNKICEDLRPELSKQGIETRDGLRAGFVDRVRNNLHIMLCHSPVGDSLRVRCRQFPSLINCTTIDWFSTWPKEALTSVARQFLKEEDLGGENVNEAMCDMCAELHWAVESFGDKFFNELRRRTYTTPKSFLDMVELYIVMLSEKRGELKTQRDRLSTGVTKLNETNAIVENLQVELTALAPVLKTKGEEAEKMIEQVTKESEAANIVKVKVEADEIVVSKQAAEVKVIADDAQADLDVAMPALHKSLAALDKLEKSDITEIKQFNNPPEMVAVVMEAICLLLHTKTDWKSAKSLLGQMDFMDQLKKYDKDNIDPKIIKKLKKYINDERFTPENLAKISKAAVTLCMWVHAMNTYDRVAKTVGPKKAKVDAMNAELKVVQDNLKKKQDQLAEVIAKVDALQTTLDETLAEKKRLEDAVELTGNRLQRAEKLTVGLADEQVRWAASVETLGEQIERLVGDIFISAACISYYGPFTGTYRTQMVTEWIEGCVERKIPISPGSSMEFTLGDPMQIRQWQIDGLPKDQVSTNNAIMVTRGKRWPLMIDPQEQAKKWIKTMEASNKLGVTRINNINLLRVLEQCIRMGRPLLIEDIGETLDPALESTLQKATFKQGGRVLIRIGDGDVDYDPNFKLYASTKMPNPHYLPEVCIKVTIINFTVTEQGLQDQLLGDVVVQERPDVEQKMNSLVISIAADQKTMRDLESRILKALSESTGNVLDDVDLIQTLDDSKAVSSKIVVRLAESEVTQKEIQEVRVGYTAAAVRGSIFYFVIADLANIDPMYQYSLAYFKRLFNVCIEKSEKSKDLNTRLNNLNAFVTEFVYINVCRGLFEKHKLTFSLLLTVQIMKQRGDIEQKAWMLLLRGSGIRSNPLPNPDPSFIVKNGWNLLHVLSEDLPEAFGGLTEELIGNKAELERWKTWANNAEPENTPLPGAWNHLNAFQKMLIIKCFREEKGALAVAKFVLENMPGENPEIFVQAPPVRLEDVYTDTDARTPAVFILSTGADPVGLLFALARSMNYADRIHGISLGQGQGPKALKLMDQGQKSGDWVLLQNCHLAKSWMGQLEDTAVAMSKDKKEDGSPNPIHPDFRLWLTSMPATFFPVPILQNGVKMTNEPPRGLRANLMRSLTLVGDWVDFEQCEGNNGSTVWKKLAFSVCFFHAMVQERTRFGSLGWNIPYEFNDSDLEAGLLLLKMFLVEQPNVPYDALQYMTAVNGYGGRVTDFLDERCIETVLTKFYNPAVLKENYCFDSEGVYKIPSGEGNLQSFVDYTKTLPLTDPPDVFGMHENASITVQFNETRSILGVALSVQPRDAGGGGGKTSDEVVSELATEFASRMPPVLMEEEAGPTTFVIRGEYMDSLGTALKQELTRYNNIIVKMASTLIDIQRAIRGEVLMSAELDEQYTAMLNNQVPANWASVAYPSLKPLASWMQDLIARLTFMRTWLVNGPPNVFWFGGFYFPQGFLTGAQQNHSRKYRQAIDSLDYSFTILDTADVSEIEPDMGSTIDGVLCTGMYFDGARWDYDNKYVCDPRPAENFTLLPVTHFLPVPGHKPDVNDYACPCYKTSTRSGALSTTGMSTNYVLNVELPCGASKRPSQWVLAGVALLTNLDD